MRGWEVRITHAPHSRDALTRATAVAGRAYARKGRNGRKGGDLIWECEMRNSEF